MQHRVCEAVLWLEVDLISFRLIEILAFFVLHNTRLSLGKFTGKNKIYMSTEHIFACQEWLL